MEAVIEGLGLIADPYNIGLIVIGVLIGVIVGALPGLSSCRRRCARKLKVRRFSAAGRSYRA